MASRSDINNIFDKIDKLSVDDIRSLNDLLGKLKPILNEIAYYSLIGTNELEYWHNSVNSQIRQEVESSNRQQSSQSSQVGLGYHR